MKTENKKGRFSKWFRKGPLENVASMIIGLGVFMFMQPFSIFLYSHSFKFILTGTVMFLVVSHFSEE